MKAYEKFMWSAMIMTAMFMPKKATAQYSNNGKSFEVQPSFAWGWTDANELEQGGRLDATRSRTIMADGNSRVNCGWGGRLGFGEVSGGRYGELALITKLGIHYKTIGGEMGIGAGYRLFNGTGFKKNQLSVPLSYKIIACPDSPISLFAGMELNLGKNIGGKDGDTLCAADLGGMLFLVGVNFKLSQK